MAQGRGWPAHYCGDALLGVVVGAYGASFPVVRRPPFVPNHDHPSVEGQSELEHVLPPELVHGSCSGRLHALHTHTECGEKDGVTQGRQ